MSSNTHHRIVLIAIIGLFTGSVFAQTAEELYETGMYEYNQINYGAAMSKFKASAELGYAPAQAKLGTLMDASEFNEEAREWFRKAAEQGDLEGQMGLARMLSTGDGGEVDLAGARELYVTAAENGSFEAMRVLHMAYTDGGFDLEADPEQAAYWLKRAADEGDRWSQEQLAAPDSAVEE